MTHRIETEHDLSLMSTKLSIKYDGTGLASSLTEPEFHTLRSLLVAIRPYILAKDDVYLPTTFKDCRVHITDANALAGMESAATAYDQLGAGGGIQVEIDGVRVTPDEAANLFLYGGDLIHSDKDKEDRIASLDQYETAAQFKFVTQSVQGSLDICSTVLRRR